MYNPVSRLLKEHRMLQQQKQNGELKGIDVGMEKTNSLRWHFALYEFQNSESPYKGGCYHGVLTYPKEYPFKPPNIKFITPNGRFEPMTSVCFSMSDYHPETWNPAWNITTILLGIIAFMEDSTDTMLAGGCLESVERRRQLAIESWNFNSKNPQFCELFPHLTT